MAKKNEKIMCDFFPDRVCVQNTVPCDMCQGGLTHKERVDLMRLDAGDDDE